MQLLLMLPTENSYTALCNILQIFFSNIAFLETPRDIKNTFLQTIPSDFPTHCFSSHFPFFFFLASFLSVDDKSSKTLPCHHMLFCNWLITFF